MSKNNTKIQQPQQSQDQTVTTDTNTTTTTTTTNKSDIVDIACACVLFETSYGDIIIDLSIETKEECLLVYNFLLLCYTRYYSNTLIHTIIPNRFVYCGDPSGTGIGGTSIYGLLDDTNINDNTITQIDKTNVTSIKNKGVSYLQSNQRFLKSTSVGTSVSNDKKQCKGLLLATCINNIPDTIGSQFIITISSGIDHAFDGYNTGTTTNKQEDNNMSLLFRTLGIVVEDNNNVLDQFNTSYVDTTGRPYADIRIHRAIVIHDPFQCMSNSTTPTNPFLQLLDIESKQSIDSKIVNNFIQNKFKSNSTNKISEDYDNDDKNDNNNSDSDSDIEFFSPYVPPEELYHNCRPIEETVASRISIHDVLDEKKKQQSGTIDQDATNDEDEEETNVQQLTAIEMDMIQQADARSREVVLQMIGDIPDSLPTAGTGQDNNNNSSNTITKPPENVLFICKLNSITTDDDLQLIFSRFDSNVTVEIIRDIDTYQSLQYGFIEFTTNEQANEAYLKMNNILIDDRRIHIDFSQSVAKIWDRYNQRLRTNNAGSTKNSTTTTSMPRFEKNGDPRTGMKQDNGTNNNNSNNSKNIQNKQQQQHSGSNYKNNSNSNNLRPQYQQQQKQRQDQSMRHHDSAGSNRRQNMEYNNGSNSNHQRNSEYENKSTNRDGYNYHGKGVNRGRHQDDNERQRFRNDIDRDYNHDNRNNNQHSNQRFAPKGDGRVQQYDEYGRKRVDSDRSNSNNNNKYNNSKGHEDREDSGYNNQYRHGRQVGNSVGDQNDDRNWRQGRDRQQRYESDVHYNRDRSRSRHDDANNSLNNNRSKNNNDDRRNRRRIDDDKYLSKSPNRHHEQHNNDRDNHLKSHSLLKSDKNHDHDRENIQNNNDNNDNDGIEDAERHRHRRESSSRKRSRREEEDSDSEDRNERKEMKKERKMKKRKHTGKDDNDDDNDRSDSQSRRKDKKKKKLKEKKRKQHRHRRRRDSSASSSSSSDDERR